MTADLIQSAYRHTWWGLVVRGLVSIALGAIIMWRPLDSIAGFALFIALWALFNGVVLVVHAFELRAAFDHWWVLLVSGLVNVGFGAAALYYYPELSLAYAVIWTAWWLLITGGLAIYAAVVERQIGVAWGWTLTFGVVSIVCGVLAIMNPPATLAALMGLIAGFAFATGVVLLIAAYRLSSFKHEVGRIVGAAAAR